MKPKGQGEQEGLLEYMEDIIGTAKYQAKQDEYEVSFEQAKLERLEEESKKNILHKTMGKETAREVITFTEADMNAAKIRYIQSTASLGQVSID